MGKGELIRREARRRVSAKACPHATGLFLFRMKQHHSLLSLFHCFSTRLHKKLNKPKNKFSKKQIKVAVVGKSTRSDGHYLCENRKNKRATNKFNKVQSCYQIFGRLPSHCILYIAIHCSSYLQGSSLNKDRTFWGVHVIEYDELDVCQDRVAQADILTRTSLSVLQHYIDTSTRTKSLKYQDLFIPDDVAPTAWLYFRSLYSQLNPLRSSLQSMASSTANLPLL